MVWVVIAAAMVLEVVALRVVATGRASVWRLMVAVFAVHGVAAALLGSFGGAPGSEPLEALALGAGSGALLYGATRGFVGAATRVWPRFRRAVADRYGLAAEVSLGTALLLSVAVAVPGEELFWRGLVQRRLAEVVNVDVAAILAWVGYAAVNLVPWSLPIALSAIVGGAVWAWLSWLTGGIVASLVSHAIWTALMLAFPPEAGKGMMVPA